MEIGTKIGGNYFKGNMNNFLINDMSQLESMFSSIRRFLQCRKYNRLNHIFLKKNFSNSSVNISMHFTCDVDVDKFISKNMVVYAGIDDYFYFEGLGGYLYKCDQIEILLNTILYNINYIDMDANQLCDNIILQIRSNNYEKYAYNCNDSSHEGVIIKLIDDDRKKFLLKKSIGFRWKFWLPKYTLYHYTFGQCTFLPNVKAKEIFDMVEKNICYIN